MTNSKLFLCDLYVQQLLTTLLSSASKQLMSVGQLFVVKILWSARQKQQQQQMENSLA